MYIAINTGLPIEEKFAPFAAVLTALKDLTDLKGRGDAPAPVPAWVPERIIKKLEIDPTAWFTTSAIAKRTRKLAKKALGGYSSDIATPEVEAICQNLVDSNLAEVQRITVKRSQLTTALRSVVFEQITDEEISSAITAADLPWSVADFRRVLERLALQDLGVPVNGDPNEDIALCFYKLYDGVSVPPVGIKDGGLDLYHILNAPSEDANRFDRAEWLRIRSQWLNLAERCKIPTEDGHYQAYKDERRRQVFDRVDFFTRKLEAMRGEGLGIYLHPTYYRRGEGGEPVLDLDRINTFYVLWGFEALREHPCQAAELAAQCRAHNLPILANTPGEVFEVEAEPGTSFIRTVALSTTEQMQEIIEIIRTIATNLAFSAGGCE
jgi:hypothetical protein